MKKKLTILTLFLSIIMGKNSLWAQETRDYEQIRYLLDNKYYGRVLPILEEWIREDSTQYLALFYASLGYIETQKPEKAFLFLKKLHEKKQDQYENFDFWYAKTCYLLERFNSSLFFLNKYLEKGGNKRKEAERIRKYCENAVYIGSKVRNDYSLEALQGALNTELSEFGAMPSFQPRKLGFNRLSGSLLENWLGKGTAKNELLFSQENQGRVWENPQAFASHFSEQTVGLQWLNKDREILLLEDKKLKISQLQNGKWSVPQIISDKLIGISSACYLKDEKKGLEKIIFSARPPLEQMDYDLFEIEKQDEKWSKPTAITELNTKENEISPFWDKNKGVLYFSSEGHLSLGGLDVFKTSFDSTKNRWQEPENMGFPINSVYDELSFISEGDFGYLSSNRLGGKGLEDIYKFWTFSKLKLQGRVLNKADQKPVAGCRLRFELRDFTLETLTDAEGRYETLIPVHKPIKISVFSHNRVIYEENWALQISQKRPNISIRNYYINHANFTPVENTTSDENFWVRGTVRDAYSNEAVSATIRVRALDSTKEIEEGSSWKNGFFEIKMDKIWGKYWLECNPKGYFYERILFNVEKTSDSIRWDLQLKKIETNAVQILKNVYFETGSAKLKDNSFAELEQLAFFLEQNSHIKIEIAGHTDNLGEPSANLVLSEKRAKTVQDYLVKKGIGEGRLRAVGYGDTQPLASNDDEEDGRELNRRIEIRIR